MFSCIVVAHPAPPPPQIWKSKNSILKIRGNIICLLPDYISEYLFTEIRCGDPPVISFASPGRITTLVDSIVNYTCDIGHVYPNGLQSQNVTCTDTGQWISEHTGCHR